MPTKGAIVNLVNRYKAVLKKCSLLNTFGSLAIVALLVGGVSSASFAADRGSISATINIREDTTVTADRTTDSSPTAIAGITSQLQSISVTIVGSSKLTVNCSGPSYDALYGIYTPTGSIVELTGNLDINITASDSQQSRLMYSNGGKIKMNGIISAFSTGDGGSVVGVDAQSGSTVSLSGEKTSITIDNASDQIYGVQSVGDNSNVEFSADETILSINASTNASTQTQAVYTHNATTSFTGNTTITVKGHNTDSSIDTLGINAEGDPSDSYDSVVTFSGDSTSIDVEDIYNVYTVTPSGGKSSISFDGKNVNLTAVSEQGTAAGILSQYGGSVRASADMNITAKSTSGDAAGIILTTYSNYAGNANFTGNLLISSSSEESNAFGIYNYTLDASEGLEDNGHLSVSGTTSISAYSNGGNAYGLYSQGNYAKNTLTGNNTILVSSTTGNSFGIVGEDGAEISLGAEGTTGSLTAESEEGTAIGMVAENGASITSDAAETITAKSNSGDAVGLYAEGGQSLIRLGGDVTVEASSSTESSTAVLAENGAEISLGAEGTTSSITATGTDSTAVALTNGSSIAFSGTTSLSADTAFVDDGTGVITNSGYLSVIQGTVSGFTGSYVQTAGVTLLGESSGFFGGNVTLEKGALAVNMADMGGLTTEENQALLALGSPITIADGKTLIVGTVDSSISAAAAFGSNSVLVVDGLVSSENAMLNSAGGGSLFVESGAQLYIANAQSEGTYIITSGLDIVQNNCWETANLLTGRLITATTSLSSDGRLIVSTKALDAGQTLPGVISVNTLNAMMSGNLNNTNASSMGIRFLSRAMDETFITPDTLASATVNEVSRAAVTAGVQNTALRLAEASTDQLTQHLSLNLFNKDSSIHRDGTDVWATPMYGNTYTHGMTASGDSVRGNYGGLALGADTEIGKFLGGSVRVGTAVHGGGGKSETRGTATSTENTYNFGGVNLYAGWRLDNLNIMGSVGYSIADHNVKMGLPYSMGINRAKADVNTRTFIADLRGEYQIHTPVADILPHAGVRYTALQTKSHDLTVDGSLLNHASSDTQNIVQFPIGVSGSKRIDVNGWIVKPQVDVSAIPAVGKRKNTTRVSYADINAFDTVNTRIMDSMSVSGMAGIQAEKGNLAFGLTYGVQASRHETDQRANVSISWKF